MNTYIIRPYYGYDCNSEMGFNNGNYLDSIEIMAWNEQEAIEKAIAWYVENTYPDGLPECIQRDSFFGDNTLYEEFSYNDKDGKEISQAEYQALDESEQGGYLYKYIDFTDITVKK